MYRNVSVGFWTDKKVQDNFTPEDKYFFIYLITNPLTNMAGCYELSIVEASQKTGYNQETIYNLLTRMEEYHDVIRYDKKTGEVLIINWGKYNWGKSPLVKKNVLKFAEMIKNPEFKKFVLDSLESKNFTAPQKKVADIQQNIEKIKVESFSDVWPKEEEVAAYVNEKGYGIDARAFWFYHNLKNWRDANGNPIKDWKRYLDKCEENGNFKKVVV